MDDRSHASPNPTMEEFHPSNSTIPIYPYLIISLLENFPKRSMVNPSCRSTNPRLFPVSTPVSTIGVFKVAAIASAKLPNAMHAALKSHPKKMMTWSFHLSALRISGFSPTRPPEPPRKVALTTKEVGWLVWNHQWLAIPWLLGWFNWIPNFTKSDREHHMCQGQKSRFLGTWSSHIQFRESLCCVYKPYVIGLIDHPLFWNNGSLDLSTGHSFI